MTRTTGEQLDDRHIELRNPVSVARRGDVAFQHADAEMRTELRNCFLQQRSLASAGSADDVDGGDFFGRKLLAVAIRNLIVRLQNIT